MAARDHAILLSVRRKTMDGPMQAYGERSYSRSRVYERSGQDLELQDVISEESNSISDSSETEADPKDTADDTTQRREAGLHQKLSAIQWRKAFTLFIVVINCFLVNGSTSLIATFFPTAVMLTLKYQVFVILLIHDMGTFHDMHCTPNF